MERLAENISRPLGVEVHNATGWFARFVEDIEPDGRIAATYWGREIFSTDCNL